MKKSSTLLIVCTLAIVLAGFVNAQSEGCCLNAYTSACKAVEITLEQCCPPDNPAAFGPEGAPTYEACVDHYFFPGVSCVDVVNCTIGCCCDPYPSRVTEPECRGGVWTPFTEMIVDCNQDYCDQFNLTPPTVQPPETLDCENPYPFVELRAIKGEKFVGLSFGSRCSYPPKEYTIRRREMPTGDFQTLVEGFTGRNYVDDSAQLKWDTTYQYEVTAVYELSGGRTVSFPTHVSFTLGDLICWGVYDEVPFCVGPDYFLLESLDKPPFTSYLRDIVGVPEEDIPLYVNQTYGEYFDNGYYCDENNTAHIQLDCGSSGKTCVMTSTGMECYVKGGCSVGNPFGLFIQSREECEQTETGEKKYCFFDKSTTVVNKCYECSPMMDCYDYKSKEACESDNCRANGVKDCVWEWINEDLGIGVCKALERDNCKYCDTAGTGAVESSRAHNFIFNRCTQEKLDHLAVPGFPCGTVENVSCRDLICEGITSPDNCADMIVLDNDNTIMSGSALCSGEIKVCKWYPTRMHCVKDANGDGLPDCDNDDVACQRDRYPPRTELASYAQLTTRDQLRFRIFDKTDNQGVEEEVSLDDGYVLYLCSYGEGEEECGPLGYNGLNSHPESYYRLPELEVSVGDLIRQGALGFGVNYLKFFAVDPSKNVEEIKRERVRISTNLVGGLGVFLVSPGNNSYVNQREAEFRIVAQADTERIWKVVLKKMTGEVVATYYDGSPLYYEVDETRTINLGNDGEKNFIIEVRAGELVREAHVKVTLDTVAPNPPLLDPVQPFLEQNYVNLSGSAEPGTTVRIYAKLGEGQFEYIKSVEVPSNGRFSTRILLLQGDYQIKARAYDKALNPSQWSNVLEFTFVTGAPEFDVDPPHGAVRPFVDNVTAVFHLMSERVPLNRSETSIAVFKEGEVVQGSLAWLDNTTLIFSPSEELDRGHYSVRVTSVDTLGHRLEGVSEFDIEDVPLIVTSWVLNTFQVNHQELAVDGFVDGLGNQVVEAYVVTNEGSPITLVSPEHLPIDYFEFNTYVTLIEGLNSVIFYATNDLGNTAVEPYIIELDTTPPRQPRMGFE